MKRIIFLSLLLTGCNTDFFDSDEINTTPWTPTVAVPVGYAEFSLEELLEEADSLVTIREDANNFVTLVYDQQLFSESAEDFLGLIDQHLSQTFNINIPEPMPDPVILPNVAFQVEENLSFGYSSGENAGIDSIIFSSGELSFEIISTIKAEVEAQITIPGLLVNDIPYSFSVNLDNFGAATIIETFSQDLEDFKIKLDAEQLEMHIALAVDTYGAPVSSSDYITINFDINNLSFHSFYGNVGTRTLQIEDETFTYDIFKEFSLGEIFFDDPRMTFTVNNSFGLPVAFDFSGVYAEVPEEGRIDLVGDIINNPPQINAPDFSQVGETVTSVIEINKENSNFNEIVSSLPTVLNLPLNATTNPSGETENFVHHTSKIDIHLEAELPLDLRVLGLRSDIIFEFEGGDTEEILFGNLRIKAENGFPIEGKVAVTFRDENGDDLLTISPDNDFDVPLFKAAPVNANGIVTEPSVNVIDIYLDRDDLDLIELAKEVKLEVELNTTDAGSQQNVKLLSTYKMKVNLGIEASAEVELTDE